MARKEFTQRRRALDVIFEAEQKDILVPGLLRELLAERQEISTSQVPIQELGVSLVKLVADHLYEIDELIDTYSKWGLRRLSSLDRTILRLGVGELVFADADIRDVVNDYTQFVRELGNEKSIGFITAILNRAKDEAVKAVSERRPGRHVRVADSEDAAGREAGVENFGAAQHSAEVDSLGSADPAVVSPETLMDEAEVDREMVGDAVEAEADVVEADIDSAEVADALEMDPRREDESEFE